MSRATAVLLAITVFGVFGFAVLLGVTVYFVSRAERPDIADASFLRVHLGGSVQDAPSQGSFMLDSSKIPPIPTDIARALRKAATDDRIKGLYLDLDEPHLGWANTRELRDAVLDFRAGGKPCVAYSEGYMTQDYYLASACDRIVLAPSGVALVSGMSTSITYYKGTFDWLGIQADFEHVGDFKSAVEPYLRDGPSEPASEATNYLLDGIWSVAVGDIAKGRGKSVEEIQAMIDTPPMSPVDALEQGLVDALAYRDAVSAHLDTIKDADWPAKLQETPVTDPDKTDKDLYKERYTDIGEYVKDVKSSDAGKSAQIAVVYAEGDIVSGGGETGFLSGQVLADGPFQEWMTSVREDKDIKAVVLRINSPGGSGLASDMMWRQIKRVQAAGKPVVVSMANYAASGGYYIAAPADWIVAEPTTLTGSIGVFGGKFALSGAYGKLGMTEYEYKRGANAGLLSSSQPFTDSGRLVFRSFLEDFYAQFLSRVADGRKKTTDDVHLIAQGRVWTGAQAKDRGLVDELGGLDVAIKKAAELAKVDDYGIEQLPKEKDFFELLQESLDDAKSPTVALPPEFAAPQDVARKVILLDRVLSDDGTAAMLPGDFEVR